MEPKAVIFDIGGVLMYDVWEHVFLDDEGSIAAVYGIDRERLEETGRTLWNEFAYTAASENVPWQMLEERYWERFLELSAEDISITVEPGDLIELSQDFIRPVGFAAAAELLDALVAKGTVLGLCSNSNEFWFHRLMESSGFKTYFTPERTILSCRVGVSKADASGAMFTQVLTACGTEAKDALFVDDRHENLDRAAKLGLTTYLFPAEDPVGYTRLAEKLAL